MATSMTGKITSGADDTSWVELSDIERMDTLMIECGVMIMGKGTYESFGDDLPIGKALLVVMTHDQNLLTKNRDGLIFTSSSLKDVLILLEQKGYQKIMLAGGENLNSAFLQERLINEIRVIIKPLVIGQGKSLFNIPKDLQLKLISSMPLSNNSIELAYEVIYE